MVMNEATEKKEKKREGEKREERGAMAEE